jgi:hypothetical protein
MGCRKSFWDHRRVKARLVCPKCAGPLAAVITHVRNETGESKRQVHYRCQDPACDGEVEEFTEYRAFVRPPKQPTPLRCWLALHHAQGWGVHAQQPAPVAGGGFAVLALVQQLGFWIDRQGRRP